MSWSGVFANQERGIPLEYAGFIYTAFACTMTFMRLVGNKIVIKIGRRRTVVFGAIAVALGFTITAVVPHYIGAILGFALIGLGAANIVPQLVSFAGSLKTGISVPQAITYINALGYSGILAGPVIIGFVAKHTSIATAFCGIAVLCLTVGIVCLKIMKKKPL